MKVENATTGGLPQLFGLHAVAAVKRPVYWHVRVDSVSPPCLPVWV